MPRPDYVSTTNACKLCTPLGAALAFRGLEDAVPFLHGSQGCATYMRRYLISHFREPVDIASSALSEKHAVFGGGPNLKKGLLNVKKKYGAKVVGVASTCLTETIGDDVPAILREFKKEFASPDLPALVSVSTPSFKGTHMDGWQAAVHAVVSQLAEARRGGPDINLLPGFVSPADIRHLKTLVRAFGLTATVLPDISLTLDGPILEDYQVLPSGGTPLAHIRSMGAARGTIECGLTINPDISAGKHLEKRFGVPHFSVNLPLGLRASDALVDNLVRISGRDMPGELSLQRGRLIDAYVDTHKYVFGKRALVYGEEDLTVGLCSFLAEIGIEPVLVASGGMSGGLTSAVTEVVEGLVRERPEVVSGVDFYQIREMGKDLGLDLIVGNSKGYPLARELGLPLIRVGFPLHDRFGGQRILHVGYQGAQELLDRIVNTILERSQEDSPVGYWYL